MWERLFSLGVATSPVMRAASRAWASVVRSTGLLIQSHDVRGHENCGRNACHQSPTANFVPGQRAGGLSLEGPLARTGPRVGERGRVLCFGLESGSRLRLQGEAGHRRGGCDVE